MKYTQPLLPKHYHAHLLPPQSEEKADVSAWDLQSPAVTKQTQGLGNSLKEKTAIK